MLPAFNLVVAADGSENVTGLDLSDFPALADRSRREGAGNPTPVLNPLAGRAPYGRPLVWTKCLIFHEYRCSVPFERQKYHHQIQGFVLVHIHWNMNVIY